MYCLEIIKAMNKKREGKYFIKGLRFGECNFDGRILRQYYEGF
jgi:hypothetical protein